MFTTVGTKLYNLVNGLVATTDLNFVYNYEKKMADDGYPYATVTPSSTTEQGLDTANNIVEIPYLVVVYARNENIETQEQTIRGIVDDIMEAIRGDAYLTGSAVRSSYEIEWGYTNDEQPTRVATIKANYTLLNSI